MNTRIIAAILLALVVGFSGCRQGFGPYGARSNEPVFGNLGQNNGGLFSQNGSGNNPEVARLNQRIQELQSRVGSFDNDNTGLHSEMASLKQQLQRSNDVNFQLRQQLSDMSQNVQKLQQANSQFQQRLAQSPSTGVPGQTVGMATIRSNNSLLQKLPQIRVPGVQTRMDGDVIRVEIPTDSVLVPGTFQVNNQARQMLGDLANAIARNFPQQFVGIEAHWDSTPIQGSSVHQVTSNQAVSLLNYFESLGLPRNQLFTVGLANNRPRYQGNNSRNRRIEIVIYPETYQR